jgi:SPP1 gp7 family putative phage head morphogenesis protein
MTRRFRQLQRDIRTTIITNDVFGLRIGTGPHGLAAAPNHAFAFKTDPQKVDLFMNWLQEEMDAGILEAQNVELGSTKPGTPWQHTYIDSSFKKGLRRGRTELTKEKIPLVPGRPLTPQEQNINTFFLMPIPAETVAMVYIRAFEELKGITATMAQKISRELAVGLAEGRGPVYIARQINREVNIGATRARVLARTEVIRAHHLGTILTYRMAEVEGVRIKAEWATAGDDRVCPDCAMMEGEILTLDQAEKLIPLHPQCRCIALPFIPRIMDARKLTIEERIAGVGARYRTKEGFFRRRGFYEEKIGRRRPGTPPAGKRIEGRRPGRKEMERRRKEARKSRRRRGV